LKNYAILLTAKALFLGLSCDLFVNKYGLFAFFVPLTIYVATLNGVIWTNGIDSSILGMQFSMWKYHSFSLGTQENMIIDSVDVAFFNGRYYSAVSPGFAILAFPFAVLGFILDGGILKMNGNAVIFDEVFLAFMSSLAVFITYKISTLLRFSKRQALIASLVLAFGTSLWPFTTIVFVHGASLCFSVLAVYLLLRYVRDKPNLANLAFSGLALGLATFVEYFAALFVPFCIAYLLMKKNGKGIGPFFLAFGVGPLLQLTYNYSQFSNPLIFPEQLKVGSTGSLFARFDLLAVTIHAIFYLVSPYRGLLFFSPILLVGMYGLYRMYQDMQYRTESILFTCFFLVIMLAYSVWQDWAGGLAYGPRFLILGTPYLSIPLSFLINNDRSARFRIILCALFGISSFIQGTGALTSPFSVYGSVLTYQPLSLNIPWLLRGRLDTWLFGKLNLSNQFLLQSYAALLIIIPWVFFIFLLRAEHWYSGRHSFQSPHNEKP
jgi:hypothetical protein